MNAASYKIMQSIMCNVCKYLGISKITICGKSRERDAVMARIIFAHMARAWNVTLIDIGKQINRHHASVIRYLRDYDDNYKYDKYFQNAVDAVVNHKLLRDS